MDFIFNCTQIDEILKITRCADHLEALQLQQKPFPLAPLPDYAAEGFAGVRLNS